MIDIKIFTYREGGQGVGWERVEYFFLHITTVYYFINVIIKTLYISSYYWLRYIFYT